MQNAWYTIGKWATILAISINGMWMKIPHAIQALLMLMGLDILSGLCAGYRTRTLDSAIMFGGLTKKFSVFIILALLHVIEEPLNIPFELERIAALAFIVYEAMSIVENAGRAGAPIPKALVKALVKARIETATPEEIRREFERESNKN